jgi:hypothetical protein
MALLRIDKKNTLQDLGNNCRVVRFLQSLIDCLGDELIILLEKASERFSIIAMLGQSF